MGEDVGCVRMCRVCQDLSGCMSGCVRMCQGVSGCVRVCQGVLGCVRICQDVSGCKYHTYLSGCVMM